MSAEKRKLNGRDPNTGRFLIGNPGGGRPPMPEELKQMYQAAAADALVIARALMQTADRDSVRLEACKYITDRGYGKPVQPTDVNVTTVPDAELVKEAQEIIAKLGGSEDG